MAIMAGSTLPWAQERMRYHGFRPNSFALRMDMTTTAAAPSVIPEEFPAVTVPPF